MVSCVLGLLGAVGVFLLALRWQSFWLIAIAVFLGFQAMKGLGYARALAWLDPAMQHANYALTAIRQGAFAEAVAECDLALKLIPQGHKLRDNVDSYRAGIGQAERVRWYAVGVNHYQNATCRPKGKIEKNVTTTCPNPIWFAIMNAPMETTLYDGRGQPVGTSPMTARAVSISGAGTRSPMSMTKGATAGTASTWAGLSAAFSMICMVAV